MHILMTLAAVGAVLIEMREEAEPTDFKFLRSTLPWKNMLEEKAASR